MTKRSFHFFRLEDRVLLSGEGLEAVDVVASDADVVKELQSEMDAIAAENARIDLPAGEAMTSHETSSDSPEQSDLADVSQFDPTQPIEIVFIDAGVEDADTLVADLRDGDDQTQWVIVHLDAEQNGVDQITETLASMSGVDAIHLLSHGDGDGIILGNVKLTLDSAPTHAGDIASWGHSLDSGADLLIYGCDLASTESGQDLIDMLAIVCDCDVAASDDATGHEDLGGDWLLEYHVGDVSTNVAFGYVAQASWYSTLDITTNLVSHHDFDTDASDSSGNNYDGTLTNGASIDTSGGTNQIGNGKVLLDGSNDYVALASHAAGYRDLTEGTIAAWIYADTTSGVQKIFEISDDGDTDGRVSLALSGDEVQFYVNNDGTPFINASTTSANVSTSTWTHVAVTVNSTGNKIYVNGVEQSVSYSNGNSGSNQFFDDVTIVDFVAWGAGRSSDTLNSHFDGFIDDGRVYDRALSSSDISELYNHGTGPQTFTVTNTNDSGAGSLRQAIADANASTGTLDTIDFNISGGGSHVINIGSALVIDDAVNIDATTQSGYVAGSFNPIVLDGNDGAYFGLTFNDTSDGSTIEGLVIRDFGLSGIVIASGSTGNEIAGNFIGAMDSSGTFVAGEENGGHGVAVLGASNIIGGSTAATRNVISGNTDNGVFVFGSSATSNVVQGNYIGVDATGNASLGNGGSGVMVVSGASDTTIGGTTAGARNVISGNSDYGIQISDATTTTVNIFGNFIGLNASGTSAIGNGIEGINIGGGSDITIGGSTSGARNVVSGNTGNGIGVYGGTSIAIKGNYIGTDATGLSAVANGTSGIAISNPNNVQIGGTMAGEGNVLSGNTNSGVYIANASGTTIQGNYIGVGSDGTTAIGNGDGVHLEDGSVNTMIGGSISAAANIIANNATYGVLVGGASSSGNTIRRNQIYGNGGSGIDLIGDGVTANDGGDIDTGPNNLQNWAAINSFVTDGAGYMKFDIDTTTLATGTYSIDFYASTDLDGGEVEGARYLGTADGIANGNGSVNGSFWGDVSTAGEYITLVVTDSSGNSSEFSTYATAALLTHNAPPAIVDDTFDVSPGTTATGNVLANDIDTDGGTLTIIDHTQAENGTIVYNDDGTFDIVDGQGYYGSTEFSYRVDDGQTGLAHYYGFNGDGTDSVGGNNASSINGDTYFGEGAFGQGIEFDEAGDYALIPDFNYNNEFTISFDFRVDDNSGTTFQYLYSHGTVSSANSLNIYLGEASHGTYGNEIFTNFQDSNDSVYAQELNFDISSIIGDGQWHNYSVSVSSLGTSVYLDGVLQATDATRGGDAIDANTGLYLGGRNDLDVNRFYSGGLDSLRIHDEALTASEIADQADLATNTADVVVQPVGTFASSSADGGLSINDDGGDDVYLVADQSPFSGQSETTIEVEFSIDTPATGMTTLFSYTDASNQDELYLGIDTDGEVYLRTSENGGVGYGSVTNAPQLFDGEKHTVSVTWDNAAGILYFYVDGEKLGLGRNSYQTGTTIDAGGTVVFGQHQGAPGSTFQSADTFEGTLYQARIFDHVRTEQQIASSYRTKLPHDESGLLAQWAFDQLSTDGVVTESVRGNNLTLKHTDEVGFTASEASLTFSLDENAIDGTVVGQITGVDAQREAQIGSLLAADADLRYSAETGKFYKAIRTITDWTIAESAALATNLNSVGGELATVRSAHEHELITAIAVDENMELFLGGTDGTIEGEWRWREGGDDADQFWSGGIGGFPVDGAYQNWVEAVEPNNAGGAQNYLVIRPSGDWDDEGNDGGGNNGYLIQWDADEVLDATQALNYSIQSQTVAGAFEIDASTGELRVADGSLLDYETDATHSITVRTTDVDSNTYDQVFTVSLSDLAESNNAPTNLSSGIELNTDGGNDAYLVANDGAALFAGLSSLTLETTLTLEQYASTQSSVLSYSTAGDTVSLLINPTGSIGLEIDGQTTYSTDAYVTELGKQYSVAASWDNTNGDIAIYLDGELIETFTGVKTGYTVAGGGEFAIGQDSDGGPLAGLAANDTYQGTLYDVRIWDEVRSESEISLNYQNKFDSGSLPSGLIANWQMDGFNGSNEVVDIVSGNNLSIGHATGFGFIASTPVEDLHISENATDGTSVGYVVPSDPVVSNDKVSDGLFLEAPDPGTFTRYTVGQTFGDWTVESGNVDLLGTAAPTSPLGGRSVELNGDTTGVISQTISTVAGQQYQLFFEAGGNFSGGQDHVALRASLGGTTEDIVITEPTGWSMSNPLSTRYSMTFTADSSSTVLRFASLDTGSLAGVIADVQVIEMPAAVTAILNNDPTLDYDAGTGKFYRHVAANDGFLEALDNATGSVLNGVAGELLTIESDYENQLWYERVVQTGGQIWLGAEDVNHDGNWNWLDGDAQAENFWTGGDAGNAVNGSYASEMHLSEAASEVRLRINETGAWGDASNNGNHDHVIQWDASEVLSGFTFSLSDDAGGRFAIDESTGEITVADGSLIDYESATSHIVGVLTTDAAGNSYTESMVISVDDASGDAVLTVPISQTTDEDTPMTFSSGGGNAIVINSGSSDDPIVTVSLTVAQGSLTLNSTTGITFLDGTSDGNATLSFSGTESDINSALDGLQYLGDADYNGADTLTVTTGSELSTEANLYARYEFLNGSTADESGNGYDGTATGDPMLTSDAERGDVMTFDGDDRVTVSGGTAGLGDEVTISAWVNLDAGQQDNVFLSIGDDFYITLDESSGSRSMSMFANGYTTGSLSATNNIAGEGWNHVAATLDDVNKVIILYLNGDEIRRGTFSFSDIDWGVTGSPDISIGARTDGTNSFHGSLDDVRVYDRVLTETEISAVLGDQGYATGDVAITVDPVNDDPTNVDSLPSGITVTEDLSSNVDLSSIDLNDVDVSTESLSVKLTTSTGGNLTAAAGSGVLITNNGTGAITLTGSQADLNVYLNTASNVQYLHGTVNTIGNDADTIQVEVNDNGNTGTGGGIDIDLGTVNVEITGVNDAPVMNPIGPVLNTNEDAGSTVASVSSLLGSSVTDPDGAVSEGIAIFATDISSGTLEYSTNGGSTWNSIGTVSETNALLLRDVDLMRFTPSGETGGTLTMNYHAWDQTSSAQGNKVDVTTRGGSTAFSLASDTVTANIADVNDAPMAANIEGTGLSYTENDGAVAVTQSITFTDVDDTHINSAVIQITSDYASSEDTLSFIDQNGITGSYDAGIGSWTLTGSATLAQYETAIRSITYTNSSENPDTTTRTVSFTVNDGDANSNTLTRDINVDRINDDPTNAGSSPSDVTVAEDISSSVDLSAIDFSDVDADGTSLTVTLTTSTGGELTTATGTGITLGGSATARTFTGTLTDLNNYFDNAANITYAHGTPHTFGNDADVINVVVNDNGNTGTGGGTDQNLGTVNVDIAAVNDAPVMNPIGPVLNTNEDAGPTVASVSSLLGSSVTDPDGAVSEGIAIFATDISSGTLEYSTNGGSTWNSIGAVSGTNALLLRDADLMRFTPNGETGGTLTMDYHAWDQTSGAQGNKVDVTTRGGSTAFSLASDTVTANIADVNDAPMAANIEGTVLSYTENDGVVAVTQSITFTDVDDTLIHSAVVEISGNYNAFEDVLSFTSQNGIFGSYNAADGIWTLTGSATLADYETAIRSITYSNTSENPDTTTRTVSFTLNDGDANSNTQTRNITIERINDGPDVTGPGSVYTVNEQTGLNIHGTGFSVTDVDAASGAMTATLVVGEGDVVVSAGNSGVTIGTNNAGTVSFTGTLAQINNLLTGGGTGTIVYINASDTPSASTTITVTVNDGGNTGTDPALTADGNSEEDSASQTINIADINDTPDQIFAGSGSNLISNGSFESGETNWTTSGVASAEVRTTTDGSYAFQFGGGDAPVDGGVSQAITTEIGKTYTVRFDHWGFMSSPDGSVQSLQVEALGSSSLLDEIVSTVAHDTGGGVTDYANHSFTFTADSTSTLIRFTDVSSTSTAIDGYLDDVRVYETTATLSIAENSANNTFVGAAAGTDPDRIDRFTYSLDADATGRFTIDDRTGAILVADSSQLNFEADTSHSITVRMTDEGGLFTTQAIMINVTDVNEAPILSVPGTQSATEDTPRAIAGISVADVDTNVTTVNLSVDNGNLSVTLSGAASISAGSNASSSLTVSGTQSEINATLASLSYVGDLNFNGSDLLTVTVHDAGALIDVETVNITVAAGNDAPVLTPYGPTYATTEDSSPIVASISALLGTSVSDVNSGAVEGIAITNAIGAAGLLEYSVNGGSTWTSIGTVSSTNALLLRSNDWVRFSPDGDNGGTMEFGYRAWDRTSGSVGTKVDASVTGGTTAFSSASDLVTVDVSSINDAPRISDSAVVNLAGTNEDMPSPATFISSILTSAGHDDVDTGAVQGVAVTSSTGNGTWQYSTDGTNWTDFGGVSDGAALHLSSSSQVRYSPDTFNGETANFGFVAWDQTSGTASTPGSPSYGDSMPRGNTQAHSIEKATASIAVTDVDDAVIAIADTDSAVEAGGVANATPGSNATGNVLNNDHEVDAGDTLNVIGVTAGTSASASGNVATSVDGTYGAITINTDGSYTYVIDDTNPIVQALRTSGESVSDTFTYTVQDSGSATSSTQISILISGQNDAPEAQGDNAVALEAGGPTNTSGGNDPTGNVLTNDVDVDAGDTKTVVGVDAGTVGSASGDIGSAVTGAYGSITINANGSYTYNVDNSNTTVQALRTSSDTITDVFTYTMQDTDGLNSTTQVTVTIQGNNDAPTAVDDHIAASEAGGVANGTSGIDPSGNVLANDTDTDGGDSQTVVGIAAGAQSVTSGNVGSGVTGSYGTIVIDSLGNYTYTVNNSNSAVQALRTSGETITEVFTYTMQDAAGMDSTAEVTVTISGGNDAPVAVANAATAIEASGILNNISGTDPTGNVLTNDTDVDAGETKTVVGVSTGVQVSTFGNVSTIVTGTYGELVINANGSYTYTLDNDNADVEALNDGQSLSDTFSYTLQDTAGLESTTQISIAIHGRTDQPFAVADQDTSVEAGGDANATPGTDPSGNVLANDVSGNGKTVVGVAAGQIDTASGSVGVTVTGSYGSVVIDANGDYTYTLDNTNPAVEALLNSGDHVTDYFTYTKEDTFGNETSTELTITINGSNDAPVAFDDSGTAIESGGVGNSSAGSNATGNVLDNDADVDSGDTKMVNGVAAGSVANPTSSVGASVVGNYGAIVINGDGTYTYVINENAPDVQALRTSTDTLTDVFSYQMVDTAGADATAELTITIQGSNDAPTAVADAVSAVESGGVSDGIAGINPSGNVLDNDNDVNSGDTKTVTGVAIGTVGSASGNVGTAVTGSYGEITIDASGNYAYTVDNDNATVKALRMSGQTVTETFTYTIEDEDGLSSSTQVIVTIAGANDNIDAVADTATASEAGGIANEIAGVNPTGNVLANDTDDDAGDTATVRGVAAGVLASASTNVGSSVAGLYGSINISWDGSYTYVVDNDNPNVQNLLSNSDTLKDVFTYSVEDTAGAVSTTQMTVTIEGRNDDPVISVELGDSVSESINESNATLTTSGTFTVADPDLTDVVTSAVTGVVTGGNTNGLDSDNSALLAMLGSTGTVLDSTEKSNKLSWSFDSSGEAFDYLAAGESLTLTYTIEVTDIAGAKHARDVLITINGTNDAPVITDVPDSVALTETDTGLASSGTLTVTDLDRTDNVTAAVESMSVSGSGVASLPADLNNANLRSYLSISPIAILDDTQTSADLIWNFDSGVEAFNFLADGETLILAYTINATDDDGTPISDTETVTITITGTNDAPVAVVDSATGVEASGIANGTPGSNPSGNVMANDIDVDLTDSRSVTGVVAGVAGVASGSVGTNVDGAYGTITIQNNGSYLYSIDNSNPAVESLRTASNTLEDVFTYTIVDTEGVSSTTQITITIEGANDAPSDLTAPPLNIDENLPDSTVIGTITTSDPDFGDSTSYRLTDDAAARFDIDAAGNLFVIDSSRLDYESTPQHDVTIEVTDAAGAILLKTFTIYLNDLDEFNVTVPVDADAAPNEANEDSIGAAVGITASAFDGDGSNNVTTYSLTNDAGGRFTIDAVSGVVTTANALDFEAQSSHLIEVRAMSQDGSISTQGFTIQVIDLNEAPIAINDSYNTLASQSVSLTTPAPTGNDTDAEGDDLAMVVVTQPAHGTLTIATDGSLIYTPYSGFFGTDSFNYRASDGSLNSDNIAEVKITVQGGGASGGGGSESAESGGGNEESGNGASDESAGSGNGKVLEVGTGGNQTEAESQDDVPQNEESSGSRQADARSESGFEFGLGAAEVDPGGSAEMEFQSHSLGRSYRFMYGYSSSGLDVSLLDSATSRHDDPFQADQDSMFAWYVSAETDDLIQGDEKDKEILIGTVGTSLGLASIGYVLWAIRGGMFVATMYAGIPSWRMLDPATLLNAYRDDNTAKDRVEEMLDKK